VAGRLSESEEANREVRSESREVERSAERECEPGGGSESVLEQKKFWNQWVETATRDAG
jgi:hypothetical protein